MCVSSAARGLVAFAAVCLLSAPALAQQAYCSCCGGLFTPAGSKWIGADRNYRGLCDKCTENGCVDCAKSAAKLRNIYDRLMRAQQEEGQTVAQLAERGREIEYFRQRWADLRYLCLAMGHGDIGRLDPGTPDLPPSQGLRTEGTKERFRNQAAKQTARLSMDPELPDAVFEGLFNPDPLARECIRILAGTAREKVRMAQLMDRFAKDPPDDDYEEEVQPTFTDMPSARGRPRVVEASREAAKGLSNSNAYGEAYLVSFERYQGAERAGNKKAMGLQERSMAKFAFFAAQQARRAALAQHEAENLWLQLMDEHRAALAKIGESWQDDCKAAQAKLKADGWPAEFRAALSDAGVSNEQADEWLKAALALTPDDAEKSLVARRERWEAAEAMAKLLNDKGAPPVWPEPPHIALLELLAYEAQLLHAEGSARRVKLPADDPFAGK